MKPIFRQGLGLLGGVAAASVCIMAIEWVGHALLTPQGAFGAACAALATGAFAGGLAASRIANDARMTWSVLAVLAVLTAVNVQSFPHPDWFLPAAIACLILGASAATALRYRRRLPS